VIINRWEEESTAHANPKLGEIVLSVAASGRSATSYHLYLAYPAASGSAVDPDPDPPQGAKFFWSAPKLDINLHKNVSRKYQFDHFHYLGSDSEPGFQSVK
jgi:hypothetical protein